MFIAGRGAACAKDGANPAEVSAIVAAQIALCSLFMMGLLIQVLAIRLPEGGAGRLNGN
jgi:hypothetical protein